MGSAVSGLGSYDPATLNRSLTPTATSATSAVKTRGVSAKQELSALQESGQLESLLSGSIAAGVIQITNPPPATPVSEADAGNQVNHVIAAYTTPSEAAGEGVPHNSAATWPSNPALAIIRSLENTGVLGPARFDRPAE